MHGQHMLEDDGDMPMVVVVAQPSSNSVKGEHGGGGHDGDDDDDDVEDMRSKDEEGNHHRPPPRCTLDTEKCDLRDSLLTENVRLLRRCVAGDLVPEVHHIHQKLRRLWRDFH